MSFWKFGFAGQSSIDQLLVNASPPADGQGLPTLTLEQLLEEDDLLQEVKTQHTKLLTFLARPHVVRRMLDYVDGTAFEDLEASQDETEAERERKRRKYPYLCSEILCTDIWSILETVFRSTDVYLAPFWNSVLDRDSSHALESYQLALWAKVNGAWLGVRTTEMMTFVKGLPSVVERLVSHISSPSIADLLFRLVQCEETPAGRGVIDWLAGEHLIARLITMLAPGYPPDAHATVAEFLKAIVAFCSNANAAAATAELQPTQTSNLPSYPGWDGEQSSPQSHSPPAPRWASNRLLRDLAALDSISTLVSYILDPPGANDEGLLHVSLEDGEGQSNGALEDARTPRPGTHELPSRTPSPPEKLDYANDPVASASSSLIQSTSVLIDLIRKNNSDFTEQQILNVLRKQAREDDLAASTNTTAKHRVGPHGPSVVQLNNLLNVVSSRLEEFQRLMLDPPHNVEPIETTLGKIEPLTIERFRISELYAELLHCSNMALLNRMPGESPMYDEDGYIVGGTEAIDALAYALAPGEPMDPLSPILSTSSPRNGPSNSTATSQYNSPNPNNSGDDHLPTLDQLTIKDSPPQIRSYGSSETGTLSAVPSGASSPSIDSESGYLTRDEVNALKILKAQIDDDEDTGFDFSPPNRPPEKPRPGSIETAGHRLKVAFLEHRVIDTLLDFFFAFPWNNLLHNCVYDLVQQILSGRTDRSLSRKLCHALFLDCQLPRRILEGHARNAVEKDKRLGYMGHLSLVADEVVKYTVHHEEEVRTSLASAFPQPEWSHYVSTTLREMRDRDMQPLGGGVAQPIMEAHQASLNMSDEDDEFPMSGAGGQVTKSLHDGVPRADEIDLAAGELGSGEGIAGGVSSGKALEAPTTDQFARYLVSQISGDLPDKFSGTSSDEEDAEEVVGWVGDSAFDPKDVDIELGEADRDPPSFGFDDRWSIDRKVLGPRRHSEEEEAFSHASSSTAHHNPFSADTFQPVASSSTAGKNLTPADWTADWQTEAAFDRDPFADDEAIDADSDDDFGAFESAGEASLAPLRRPPSLTDKPLSPEPSESIDFGAWREDRGGHVK